MYQCKEPDVVFQEWSTFLPFKHSDRQVLYFYLYHNTDKHLKKPKGQSRMDNPEKLATLGMQDAGCRQTKQTKNTTRKRKKMSNTDPRKKEDGHSISVVVCMNYIIHTELFLMLLNTVIFTILTSNLCIELLHYLMTNLF